MIAIKIPGFKELYGAVREPPLRELFVTANPGLYAKWDKAGILRSKVHGKDDLTIHQEET